MKNKDTMLEKTIATRVAGAILLCCLLLAACKTNPEQQRKQDLETLNKLEADLTKSVAMNGGRVDTALARQFIEKSEAFSTAFPQDTAAPLWLFKAGNVARASGRHGVAIKLWGEVQRQFPNHQRAGDALFFQAFTFENELQDKETAKRYYADFLKRYPEHPFAQDVQQLLLNIDKSPEDLIREFEEKNKQQGD